MRPSNKRLTFENCLAYGSVGIFLLMMSTILLPDGSPLTKVVVGVGTIYVLLLIVCGLWFIKTRR